jgi:phosphate transport system substrate-binding protein
MYEPVGSGRGIQDLLARNVDFAGSDAFLTDPEIEASGIPILHLPTCVGAVSVVYNLPQLGELKLTPELLTGIFSGHINKWTDREIARLNPGARLPESPITVVHRSDASGTTYVFTSYLSKANNEWQMHFGCGKTIQWPVGIGVDGNSGVAQFVGKAVGSIGYVEYTHAREQDLPSAHIRNRFGQYVRPDIAGITAAARADIPNDTRILLTDSNVPFAYPISAFTYLLFYKEQGYDGRTFEMACALTDFLSWIVHRGQDYTQELHYAPIPEAVVKNAEEIINSITFHQRRIHGSVDPIGVQKH